MDRPVSPLLALPQELRDQIYQYALIDDDDDEPSQVDFTPLHSRIKRQRTGNERWEWAVHYASRAPPATYLNLKRCNKQLHAEIQDLLHRTQKDAAAAKLFLVMQYPNLWATWHHIPGPPPQTKTLDILIKADHMYHPAFMSNGPHNAILTTVFEVVKRYIHRGPHFARPSPLHHPLKLDTVRITLAPPVPFEEMTHVYGFPAQQLEALFDEFRGLMRQLCRSGLMWPDVREFEVRLAGREDEGERLCVTSNLWDEEDFVFFRHGGYVWDAGEGLR